MDGRGDTSPTIIDLLLITVGCALAAAAAVVPVRRSPGVKLGRFAARQQRNSAARLNWQNTALSAVGCGVAASGGADAQRHHITARVPQMGSPPADNPFQHVSALAQRSLITTWRTPEALIDVTIQPVIFLALFTNVFG